MSDAGVTCRPNTTTPIEEGREDDCQILSRTLLDTHTSITRARLEHCHRREVLALFKAVCKT